MSETQEKPRALDCATSEISAQIHRLIDARATRTAKHGPDFVQLWELAAQCARGGKLLRPRLLMGLFDALATKVPAGSGTRASALELAAALEILHFSFLLHDDIIDEDLFRRGAPNLIGHLVTWERATRASHARDDQAEQRQLHWARSSALLVGDLMLTIAHQTFARANLPEPQRLRILDLLDAAVTETVAGEYCDISLAAGHMPPDLKLVLEMTRMKTAAYTFELPIRIGAIIAGSDPTTEQQLGEVGRHLGVAFQLQDDLLSAFSFSEAHGKDQFSDFRAGKETALIAYARMTRSWPRIDRLLGAADFSHKSGLVLQRLLVDCGAREFIERMVQDQIRASLEALPQGDETLSVRVTPFILKLVESLDRRRA